MLSIVFPPRCPVCETTGAAPCARCWRRMRPARAAAAPPGLDYCRSLLRYEGDARELLARLKYRNARSAVPWLASAMAKLVHERPLTFNVVTWAPTSGARRRERGYDQAEVLARAVARCLSLPARSCLTRAAGPAQTGRSRAERRIGPTFEAHHVAENVLIVDDVITTGATLVAAARALRAAGAVTVAALTAGRTPLKVDARAVDP